MNELPPPGRRHISWNGISLNVPQSWEVRAAGNHHLIFEHSFQAVLEIRWQKTGAKTSDICFKSTRDQYAKLTGKRLVLQKTPVSVTEALTEFDLQSCGIDNGGMTLVLLLHRPSGTHIIVRFHTDGHRDKLWSTLCSISCPDIDKKHALWKIQDFRVDIPPGYRLSKFTMEAGMSTLFLENSTCLLQIFRMAPADLRLQAGSLEDIFTALLELPAQAAIATDAYGRLIYRRTPSILQQIGLRLRRQKPFIEAVFWHNDQANRLQGVFLHSIHPQALEVHSRICASYEILPL